MLTGKFDNDYGIYKRCIIPFKKEDEKENSDYLRRMENKFKISPVTEKHYNLILEYVKYKKMLDKNNPLGFAKNAKKYVENKAARAAASLQEQRDKKSYASVRAGKDRREKYDTDEEYRNKIDKEVQNILKDKLKEENMKRKEKKVDILQGDDEQKFLDNLKESTLTKVLESSKIIKSL